MAVDATTLTLGFANAGARDSFVNGGCDDVLRQAAIDVVGAEWRIETIVDPSASPDAPVGDPARRAPPTPAAATTRGPQSTGRPEAAAAP